MKRAAGFSVLALAGLIFFSVGLRAPIYLSAIDSRVLLEKTAAPSLITEGVNFLRMGKIGPARIFERVSTMLHLPETSRLQLALNQFAAQNPDLLLAGSDDPYFKRLIDPRFVSNSPDGRPVVELLLPSEVRAEARRLLASSRRQGVREILQTRQLTNTTQIPSALTAGGQALDAAIVLAAVLVEEDQVPASLLGGLVNEAARANRGLEVRPLEESYLSLLSLGRRLNWGALNALLKEVRSAEVLKQIGAMARSEDRQFAALYSALVLSGQAQQVVQYWQHFPETAARDLTFALRGGKVAVETILDRDQRIFYRQSDLGPLSGARLLAIWASLDQFRPWAAQLTKYALILAGGFLWALAGLGLFSRSPPHGERNWAAPGVFFATLALLFALFLGEPYFLERPRQEPPAFQIEFPIAVQAIHATLTQTIKGTMIDRYSLFSLLVFLMIQAGIYFFCRRRLLEIKQQAIPSRLKLKLLENEEHLFDAGLYLGFVGTVVSLILVSLGVIRPSLMAAYSSTSFGIIFVSVLKIFHLRPLRRQLIIESEGLAS